MQVVLKVTSGAAANRMVVVRPGQALKVGKTSWADLSIPDDAEMDDVHFSLQCTAADCTLCNLSEDRPLLHNDEELAQPAPVADGDRITAGKTAFQVTVEGAPQTETAVETEEEPRVSGFTRVECVDAGAIAAGCDLQPGALALLEENDNPRGFLETLIEREQFSDAVLFLAAALPSREAVWWACRCAAEHAADKAVLQAARNWVDEPSEENRRAAEAAANATGLATPATCAATAAYLSGGSLSPEDQPEVPPPDGFTAKAAASGIEAAALAADPYDPAEHLRRFLALGIQIADGEDRWDR